MDLNALILQATDLICGWPLVLYVFGTSIIVTVALGFIQIRYFFTAWKNVIYSEAETKAQKADMTPFQAFLNALSASVGNGSIAGMATAIFAGGPGAAFWVFVLGITSMAVRYAEVYLSLLFPSTSSATLGGPMVYLKKVPGGSVLAVVYAFFCMMLGFVVGNSMQANSITAGLIHISGFSNWVIACILLVFIAYVMLGGAARIVKVSEALVPVKVGLFFTSSFFVLAYHYQSLIPALKLITQSAFSPVALAGGVMGFGLQQAMRFGIFRGLNASEAGLGSAAILFGATGSKNPVKDGIMSMLGPFISSNLVCFSVALLIIASGVWDTGHKGLGLTIAAYETAFGWVGGWIVAFLSITFGLGVLVAYAYITRACWLFLTNGKFGGVYTIVFCAMTFLGAMAEIEIVWNSTDLINAFLLGINLFGILWLLPHIRKGLAAYEK
jgi:AGCS family alanine or glycine:cation symporter